LLNIFHLKHLDNFLSCKLSCYIFRLLLYPQYCH
jgi:hypothetical protein